MAAVASEGAGTVRVAAFASAARQLLPRIWGGPVSLRLVEQEPDLALASVHRREVDIAVVHSYSLVPRDIPPRCEERVLLEEPVLLAAAGRADSPVRLADFADEPWLVPTSDLSCYEMIQRACGAAGFVPSVVAESADFSVLVALAAAGAGVALVPAMAVPSGPVGVGLHELAEPLTRKVFAVTRSGLARRPDVRAVLDELARVTPSGR